MSSVAAACLCDGCQASVSTLAGSGQVECYTVSTTEWCVQQQALQPQAIARLNNVKASKAGSVMALGYILLGDMLSR